MFGDMGHSSMCPPECLAIEDFSGLGPAHLFSLGSPHFLSLPTLCSKWKRLDSKVSSPTSFLFLVLLISNVLPCLGFPHPKTFHLPKAFLNHHPTREAALRYFCLHTPRPSFSPQPFPSCLLLSLQALRARLSYSRS